MLRHIAFTFTACLAFSANAAAQDEPQPMQQDERAALVRHDPFIISDEESCGAERFSHLLGQSYAEAHQASLIPSSSNRLGEVRPITLEYMPYRLNFVVNGEGRIVAVGCF